MKTRVLGTEEWERLNESGLPALLKHVQPEDAQIVAVEEGDRIVATLGVMRMVHLEGLWIAPEWRGNVRVERSLVDGAADAVDVWNVRWVIANAADDHMRSLLGRLGAEKAPLDTYFLKVGG